MQCRVFDVQIDAEGRIADATCMSEVVSDRCRRR